MRKQKAKRILWAFDPFETELTLEKTAVSDVVKLAERMNAAIEPVYVFTPFLGIETINPKEVANRIVDQFKKLAIKISEPTVLINRSSSLSRGVEVFTDYAISTAAPLIVVSSHGRRGLARMVFGSFAEALLTIAKVPLLFLSRDEAQDVGDFDKALFATDFSTVSETAFDTFLKEAKGLFKELIIYHDISFSAEMLTYGTFAGVGAPLSGHLLADHLEWAKEEAKSYVKKATKKGFLAVAVLEESPPNPAQSIVQKARTSGVDLVVMASQAGPAATVLLGSNARAVFRSGEFAVWAYGPRCFEKTSGRSKQFRGRVPTVGSVRI